MRTRSLLAGALTCLLLTAIGCSSDPEVAQQPIPPPGAGGGTGGAGADGGSGTGGSILNPDAGGGTGGAEVDAGGCSGQSCSEDQHCELIDGGPACVPNVCADLNCSATEVCVTTANGAHCKDNSCTGDLACDPSQYCNGTICVDDVCDPGDRRCDGQTLLECDQNGGGESTKYTCASGSPYYQSECADPGQRSGLFGCEDDWDCPAFTDCEADHCEGTGVKPTCSLDPEPFVNVLPTNEITWGGTQQNWDAVGRPSPPPRRSSSRRSWRTSTTTRATGSSTSATSPRSSSRPSARACTRQWRAAGDSRRRTHQGQGLLCELRNTVWSEGTIRSR